ncbi:MAG: DUF1080 domain-containing protein [Acidobacteriia bacterium]|nr:DUF1080 domain-containing protein [Terriglobia bacterium]
MNSPSFCNRIRIAAVVAAVLAAAAGAQEGYKDTPILPGQKWHVHDPDRPRPRTVEPGDAPGSPPSDAILLFDGRDLSQWAQRGAGGQLVAPRWTLGDGYFEVGPGTGDLITREKFGDCQLHLEWAAPARIQGAGQERGNSGVYMMSRYEMQVLDSYQNPTYADGQAGAIYGQWPPLVNPIRKPGEWNSYDIVFEAPRFDGAKLLQPAYVTLFFNGEVVHNRKELMGNTEYRALGTYKPHGDEPLLLQDHGYRVRFRNVWIRRLGGYDQPEARR